MRVVRARIADALAEWKWQRAVTYGERSTGMSGCFNEPCYMNARRW